MPSSTAWISCSRETCFSAFSWRRAPTKSRLTGPPPTRCSLFAMGRQQRDVGVTHVTERPFSSGEVYIVGRLRSTELLVPAVPTDPLEFAKSASADASACSAVRLGVESDE